MDKVLCGCTRVNGFCVCVTSYSAWMEDADRRHRRGERQLYCGACGKWRWPDECGHEGRLTGRQFNALCKRAEREAKR